MRSKVTIIKDCIEVWARTAHLNMQLKQANNQAQELELEYIHNYSFVQKTWGEHKIFINEKRENIKLEYASLGNVGTKLDIQWKVINLTLSKNFYVITEDDIKEKLTSNLWIPWTEKEWTLPTAINFSSIKMKEETTEKPYSSRYYASTARGRILVFTASFIGSVKRKEATNTFYLKKNSKKTAYDLYKNGRCIARVEIEKVYLSKEDFVADTI
jgi:hypothetical protein